MTSLFFVKMISVAIVIILGVIQVDGDSYTPAGRFGNYYMQYQQEWQKEIIFWAKECINEITYKMNQMDQIVAELEPDLRYRLGLTMGRIFEIHRQQVDMYRRMKRRVDNKFNWVKVNTAQLITTSNGSSYVDLKPQMYTLALNYIVKRETVIEHLVKLTNWYTGEEEVGRFRPEMLPASQDPKTVWAGYTTSRPALPVGVRQGPGGDSMEEKEEEVKAKMRSAYFKKRNRNNQKK